MKWVSAMPSAWALAFIRATNSAEVPATASDRILHASLPEGSRSQYSRSSTVRISPALMPAVELSQGRFTAWAEAVTSVSREISPASTASSTTREVMILVMEAGYIRWRALKS